ncbi:MAG TPA: hypothetical protein EYP40_01230 [Chromatiales bacterium]|nr:hypothetical protein [Chromatiales bacterium]
MNALHHAAVGIELPPVQFEPDDVAAPVFEADGEKAQVAQQVEGRPGKTAGLVEGGNLFRAARNQHQPEIGIFDLPGVVGEAGGHCRLAKQQQ